MGTHVLGGLSVKELVRRVGHEFLADKCLNRAAELGFYFTMALFPFLIFLISLMSFISGTEQVVLAYLSDIMPSEAMSVVRNWVRQVLSSGSKGLLSFGFLFALWSASTGLAALIEVLNVAYEVEEGRPFWKRRVIALSLTIALALLVMGGVSIVTFGGLAHWALGQLGLDESFGLVWRIVSYAIGLIMLFVGLGLVYYFGPNVRQHWQWVIPGSVFAVVTFLFVSYLFSLYLQLGPGFASTYGSLGAIIVLMFWLYLMSLIIMIGGEINDEIEKAAGQPIKAKAQPLQQKAA